MDLLDQLELPTVRGNHDRWVAETPRQRMYASDAFAFDALTAKQRTALGALSAQCCFEKSITAVHGRPGDDNDYLLENVIEGQLALAPVETITERIGGIATPLLLCAHSHVPRVAHAGAATLLVDPVCVGCTACSDPDRHAHVY